MIIWISGSINSGKSTVSKLLAKKLGKVAFIEIDQLRSVVEWMPLEEAIPLNLKNAISLIRNFNEEGIDTVVSYPLSEANFRYVDSELKSLGVGIKVFTLAPRIEVVLKNRGGRELSDWEKQRIRHHYDAGIANPSFGTIIDNSNISPEEAADAIFRSINER